MSSLALIDEIKNEIRIDDQGRGFVSIRGAARLTGIAHTTLNNHFKPESIEKSKLAQTLITEGFNPGSMSSFGIPDLALAVIATYYAYEAKKTTAQAKQLNKAFTAIGIRTWMQQQVGWKPQSKNGDIDKLLELRRLEATIAKSQVELVALKQGLMITDPLKYRILVDGESYASVYLPFTTNQEPEKIYVTESGQVLGKTAKGYTLTSFMRAIGISPEGKGSGHRKQQVKQLLKEQGIDLDSGEGCELASLMMEHKVIPDSRFSELAGIVKNNLDDQQPVLYADSLEKAMLKLVK